jgi:hypothetical protein
MTTQYGLTPERHAEVDAELETMFKRLVELAVEIDEKAPITDKKGFNYQAVCRAGDAIQILRHHLTTSQQLQQMSEEIRKKLGKSTN